MIHINRQLKEKFQGFFGFWLEKEFVSTSILLALIFSAVILLLDSCGVVTDCLGQYGMVNVRIMFVFCVLILLTLMWKWNWKELLRMPYKNSADKCLIFVILSSVMILAVEYANKTLYCYKIVTLGLALLISCMILYWRWAVFFQNIKQTEEADGNLFDLSQLLNGEIPVKDQPILFSERSSDKDLLGREGLVNMICNSIDACSAEHTYVIGIKGAWGSGKTTVLNIAKNRLRERKNIVIVDDFDPWIFGTQKALLSAMYDEILSKTGIKYSLYKNRMIVEKLMKTVTDSKKILGVLDVFMDDEKGAYESVKQLKENLRRYLCYNKKKIVFIIDNIDRAETDNILFLFKLIGAVFDLPNVLYVLSYDDKRIQTVFEDVKKINPNYIEKIVQQEITIPAIHQERLETICKECIENLLQCYGVSIEDLNQYDKIIQIVSESIGNLRQFKRLLNSAFVTTFCYDNELFKPHLMAIETIRFLEPDLYETIKSDYKFFVSRDFGGIMKFVGWNGTREAFNAAGKEFFDELFQKFGRYKGLLAELFPYVHRYQEKQELRSKYGFGVEEERHNSIVTIASIKYFDLYFSYGINDHLKIMKSVDKMVGLINSSNEKETSDLVRKSIIEISKKGQREWFECFQNKIGKLDKGKYITVAKEICDCFEYIDHRLQFMTLSADRRALIIAIELAKDFDDDSVNDFIESCSKGYNVMLLGNISSCCEIFMRDGNTDYLKLKEEAKKKFEELSNQIIEQEIDLYKDGFYRRFQIWSLKDVIKEKEFYGYMKKIMKPRNIFRILADMIEESTGTQGEGYCLKRGKEKLLFGEENMVQGLIQNVIPKTTTEKFIMKLWNNSNVTEYLINPFEWEL